MSETNPEPKKARPGHAAQDLILSAGRERALALAKLGMEALERGLEERVGTTGDLLLAMINRREDLTEGFFARLPVDKLRVRDRLEKDDLPAEPEMDEPLPGSESKSVLSQLVRNAIRVSRATATAEGRAEWRTGELLANALAFPESSGRRALTDLGAEGAQIDSALEWLRAQPDPVKGSDDTLERLMRDNREILYRLQPSLSAQAAGQVAPQFRMDARYEQHPEKFAAKPDLPARLEAPIPDHFEHYEWELRSSAVVEAARWEALSRRAPTVTLEHLLLALIVDGTDTSWFLDRRGSDRSALRERLEAACPTFAEGPAYPPDSPPFAMAYVHGPDLPVAFTDLAWIESTLFHAEQPASRFLQELGVTKDEVRSAIQERVTGDPHWYLKRPNLKEMLQLVGKSAHATLLAHMEAIRTAALYEARIRGSEEMTLDHILLVLLGEGTETSRWLAEQGIEPTELANKLDAALPRSPTMVLFPKPTLGVLLPPDKVPFSDLSVLAKVANPRFRLPFGPQEVAPALLAEHGITLERIQAALPPQRPVLEVTQEELECRRERGGSPADGP